MPSRPISFKHLDELCSPTSARFRFYDWPTSYMVQQRAPHGNKATFKSTHVILLGLLEEEKLKERLCTGSFVVEMHDRQVCSDGHRFDVERGEYCPTCPFGEARFDLADIAKGANYLRLRSPILPGKRSLNCCIPPGLWVEFGTSLSLKISLPFAPNSIPDSRTRLFDRPFFRAVLLLPANMVKESELVENIINTSNSESLYICTDDVNARRQALLSLTLGEELDSPLLDVISGFCFYDKAYRIYTFECANGPAFKRLHEAFSSFANGTHWEYWPCHKRIWQPASAGIVYVHLKESLFSSAKIPRNYIQGNIAGSYDCLTFLFNLAAMRNHMPIYLNCKVPSITDIFEFVHAFGEFVDFTESLGSDEEEGGCSFEDIAKQPSGYVPWKPVMSKIDDKNPEFKKSLEQRKRVHMDFIAIYNKNYPQTGIPRLRERFGKKVHNYSIQKLSTASRAKRHPIPYEKEHFLLLQ
ncbi:hypothetical protein BC829DRAFT_103466 [Chytridium lagenaria]|nr:hypothetical protein BC829DRAFT_103466 [Chytridium lagenaria]